jgi:hypothetical protein
MYRILITDQIEEVKFAKSCGIEFVMVDLEVEGKIDRQKSLNAHYTSHNLDSIIIVRNILGNQSKTRLLVRCNPYSLKSEEELNLILERGADSIMLPMFKTAREVKLFLNIIKNKVSAILLFETRDSLKNFTSIIKLLSKNDLIHFGLNDLSLELGFNFPFDVLKAKLLDGVCNLCVKNNIRFGIGGIGSPLADSIISPETILKEHYRLNSSGFILSRSFKNYCIEKDQFSSGKFLESLKILEKLYQKISKK